MAGSKKAVVLILLLAVVLSFSYAEEQASDQKNLLDSISINGGFDMLYAKGQRDEPGQDPILFSNSAFGAGASLALTLDLSAIPNFLKEGWLLYLDGGAYYCTKVCLEDQDYPGEGDDTEYRFLGGKGHLAVLRKVDFGIPIDFCFGAGLSYDMISIRFRQEEYVITRCAQTLGAAVFITADYRLGKHFAVTAVVNPDLTFFTTVDRNTGYKGSEQIVRYTSFNFGFSLGARLGFKYIF